MQNVYTKSLPTTQVELPDWDFYFCEVDDRPAIISVDLNMAAIAPNLDQPYLVYISLKINQIGHEGFPVPSELSSLCRIEDHLIETVVPRSSTRFAGRVTTNGCRDLIFYAKNPTVALGLIKTGMLNFPEYQFESGWKEDAEWGLYFDFLFPNEAELNTIFNHRVLEQFRLTGNSLPGKHVVTHTAFFQTDDQRDRFILKAIDDFFKVESVVRDEAKGQARWAVRIYRPDAMNIEHINTLTSELVEMAQECGGLYNGWEISQ